MRSSPIIFVPDFDGRGKQSPPNPDEPEPKCRSVPCTRTGCYRVQARSYTKLKNLATFGYSSKLRYARFDMRFPLDEPPVAYPKTFCRQRAQTGSAMCVANRAG